MKKIVIFLIACFALTGSTYGATSPLTESLLEYEAITSAIGTNPEFENVISSNEFIIDIQRLTRELNVLGVVKYGIVTRIPSGGSDSPECHENHNTFKYIAKLFVAPNPGIGPNIVTVLSIRPFTEKHHHDHD